jgi:alpha-2-macroglobulin
MEHDREPRNQRFGATFVRAIVCLTVSLFLFSCNKKDKWIDVDPAYSSYIDAYTTGTISKTSAIRIKLAADAGTTHAVGEEVKESLFSFSPSVKGKAFWLDARTIEFKPDSWLLPDVMYEVSFKLGKVTKVPSKFSDFKFSMKTVKPAFKVSDDGLRSAGVKNKMSFSGDLETADVEDGKQVEKLLTVSQNNKALKISWQHNDIAKTHHYIIDDIDRLQAVSNIELKWDGSPMKMDVKGENTVAVPAQGDFKVLEVVAMNDAQQYASVQFSDAIAVGQELDGLITISGQSDIAYTLTGSEVKLFGDG